MTDPDGQLAYFLDLKPEVEDFRSAVIEGLSAAPKRIPPKFFYDAEGSRIFDRICALDEYYVTRTELAIMAANRTAIGAALGSRARVVEFGCGSSLKIRALLEALDRPEWYIAVDISREHLRQTAESVASDYPNLQIGAICADFTTKLELPVDEAAPVGRMVGYFPGSTIGNQTPAEAHDFLKRVRAEVGDDGGLLIGVDLEKDSQILHAAYNDAAGVTAAFNLNLLHRMRRELDAELEVGNFSHEAFFNQSENRIEMHLRSKLAQSIIIGNRAFKFEEGETIHTENSYKYTLEKIYDLAQATGFSVAAVWTDPDELFSVQYLRSQSG